MDNILGPEIKNWLGNGAVTAGAVVAAMAILRAYIWEPPKKYRVWVSAGLGGLMAIIGVKWFGDPEVVNPDLLNIALQGFGAGLAAAGLYKGVSDTAKEIGKEKGKKK